MSASSYISLCNLKYKTPKFKEKVWDNLLFFNLKDSRIILREGALLLGIVLDSLNPINEALEC